MRPDSQTAESQCVTLMRAPSCNAPCSNAAQSTLQSHCLASRLVGDPIFPSPVAAAPAAGLSHSFSPTSIRFTTGPTFP